MYFYGLLYVACLCQHSVPESTNMLIVQQSIRYSCELVGYPQTDAYSAYKICKNN